MGEFGPEEKNRVSAKRRAKLTVMILEVGATRMKIKGQSNSVGHLHGKKNKDVHWSVYTMSFADAKDRSYTAENGSA